MLTGIIAFLLVLLVIEVINLLSLRSLGSFPHPAQWPAVAVLLPARNEARNVEACVRSLLAQDYPNFRVIALDDASSDGTAWLLARMGNNEQLLRVVNGLPLPQGWVGKNWACNQLAREADEEWLLFVDADTIHHPLMLRDAIAAALASRADLVTGLPRQVVRTWVERLAVPMLSWVIFALLPLPLVGRTRSPLLSAAVGQFMLFKRTAYEQIGGHAAVRGKVVEDIALGRAVKSVGLRLLFCDLGTRVQCRMYHNWREVWDGFGKNIFPLFNYNLPAFAFAWLWLALVFTLPPLEVLLGMAGLGVQPLALSISAMGLGVLLWLLAALRLRLHPLVCIFYPLTSLFFVLVGIRSAFSYYAGKPPRWKGRPLPVSLNAADGKANPE